MGMASRLLDVDLPLFWSGSHETPGAHPERSANALQTVLRPDLDYRDHGSRPIDQITEQQVSWN